MRQSENAEDLALEITSPILVTPGGIQAAEQC